MAIKQDSKDLKNQSHTMHVFRPRCYENINQPQSKIRREHRLNNMILNDEWVNYEIQEEIKIRENK